ncbi:acetyl-CoA/propionyl-CoA carboxylase, biotin carboxylase, biotin carboxyl carrier protein [Agromyces sp. CF514]|uniref:ATP-binding protein n=1 Tax=Agromyces sp. CF514 TaxID=1881031 RepID=UPI0008F39618|nr:biotin carboxylase N-terminal domain-containing protein [Agromyces sp. CF514]SFR88427.1 acetyl-CoA/propionyl-CoA carboxylase, biotin carboxylase, biotin carboxyl carrier protein [Agromyces sp. CF514]
MGIHSGTQPGTADDGARPFERVLVANRGEIAVRVIRTLRRLGIRSIAVFSDADADAPHVRLADEAVRIGPAPAAQSYLDPARLVAAALESGAQAVHPGYGFLSEHAGFAQACRDAGIVFVGPGDEALAVMGDKIRAKAHVAASGVPVVPGVSDADLDGAARDDAALLAAGERIGFPLLVKPSAGGGGKGMQIARDASELAEAIPAARRVARTSFGDDTLLLERLIERPRHIEVQVLADAFGAVIHLGERECSLQRRHQKVVEEAPSPLLDAETRERIGRAACDAARSVDYLGAGTVEFLVSDAAPDEFFFIEMNTRLQVEHPVTELVTGVDLVEQQLRIAAGQRLGLAQHDVRLTGHAIEARVYAESPERGFLPSTGELLEWRPATGDGVRVDAGIRTGQVITADYDPMLAKVIAFGADRAEALDRLDAALAETVVLGVDTNLSFVRRLIAEPEVRAGALDTNLIGRMPPAAAEPPSPEQLAAAASAVLARAAGAADRARRTQGADGPAAWTDASGWRVGAHRTPAVLLAPRDDPDAVVVATPSAPSAPHAEPVVRIAADGTVWVHDLGGTTAFLQVDRRARAEARRALAVRGGVALSPDLRAPMPGTVTAVFVADGDPVDAGDPIIAIEAMKMEHRITATAAGTVRLAASVGDLVSRDQPVARIEPAPTEPASDTIDAASAPASDLPETREAHEQEPTHAV